MVPEGARAHVTQCRERVSVVGQCASVLASMLLAASSAAHPPPCAPAVELDDYFGDILAVITDIEGAIVRGLEERVVATEPLLLGVAARMAELDVIAAFAEVSQDGRFTRPKMVEESVILVKGARHPLQELTVRQSPAQRPPPRPAHQPFRHRRRTAVALARPRHALPMLTRDITGRHFQSQ